MPSSPTMMRDGVFEAELEVGRAGTGRQKRMNGWQSGGPRRTSRGREVPAGPVGRAASVIGGDYACRPTLGIQSFASRLNL